MVHPGIREVSWHWVRQYGEDWLYLTIHYADMGFGRSGDVVKYIWDRETAVEVLSALGSALKVYSTDPPPA